MAVGDRLLLELGADDTWTVDVLDTRVLSRVIGVMVVRGAQGLFEARAPGSTTLTAIGAPVCTSGICPQFRVLFRVAIAVG